MPSTDSVCHRLRFFGAQCQWKQAVICSQCRAPTGPSPNTRWSRGLTHCSPTASRARKVFSTDDRPEKRHLPPHASRRPFFIRHAARNNPINAKIIRRWSPRLKAIKARRPGPRNRCPSSARRSLNEKLFPDTAGKWIDAPAEYPPQNWTGPGSAHRPLPTANITSANHGNNPPPWVDRPSNCTVVPFSQRRLFFELDEDASKWPKKPQLF